MVATGLSELVMKLVGHPDMALSCGVAGSLHAWLGQELEMRGIDAVIYTRYILSILQQDAFVGDDLDLAGDSHFFPPTNRREGLRSRRKPEKHRAVDVADCDQRKKTAAIKCLLSLSDEECGIESLVDELYLKLKEQQANITGIVTDGSSGGTSQSDTAGSSDSDSSDSAADPAQRYYEAFPALSAIEDPAPSTIAAPLPQEGGLWAAKVTQGLARNEGPVDVARRTAAVRHTSTSPRITGAYRDEDERDRENRYSRSCECHGESRRSHQKVPRCSTCESWSHRGNYNQEQTMVKKNEKSQRFSSKFGLGKADGEIHMSLGPYGKLATRNNSKTWKDYEYMRPIFIVPKIHSPDVGPSRVRSVRINQKTESVLDFFFKSRAALASPLLDQMCYCGAESIWGCTAGCVNWPEMLGLSADSEDQSWYTEPLDMMVKPSPVPSRRLYNRRTMLSSLSNIAFFENHLHVFSEALSDDEGPGVDLLGLSTLLSRTLEDSKLIEEDSSESDSFNTAEESVSDLVLQVEEISLDENCDIFADASNRKVEENPAPTGSPEMEVEEVNTTGEPDDDDDEYEEVAYPSHFRPNILRSFDDDNESGLTPLEGTCEIQTPCSDWGSPASPLNWPEIPEPLSTFEAFHTHCNTTPQTTPSQASTVESLWELQPALTTDSNHLVEGVVGVHGTGTIWGCGMLSPHLPPQDETLLNVTSDVKWGFSGSSGSNSKSASHASSQDNLYEDDGGEHWLIDDHCSCGQPSAPLSSGAFGLGCKVWEAASLSPGPMQGHIPTPISTENDVLDDRPIFYLPRADEEDYKHSVEHESNSPLPLPPLEFNFSDSDEDDEDDYTPPPPISCHPVNHSHSYPQLHQPHVSSPSSSSPPLTSFSQHSHHPHSCISSRDHVDSWTGQIDGGGASSRCPSHLAVDSCERSIMASLTCDTLESSSSKPPRAPLPDVLLTTSLPLFPGSSSIWSYCLGSLLSPGSVSDRSLFVSPFAEDWPSSELLCTLPLSPKHEGSDLSHLWDINAVHRCNICEWGSDKLAVGMETQNVSRYLMNVGLEVPDRESTCTLIDNSLCGSLFTSGPWSVVGDECSSWSMWNHDDSLPPHDTLTTPTPYESASAIHRAESNAKDSGAQLWQNFEAKPQFFRQRSTSADHMDSEDAGISQCLPSGSNELLPSENSAFCDRIPSRVSHLPHVQSEPALDGQHMPHGRVYNHGRLVQVRSLYKADASILHQLGLTCLQDEDPQTKVEVLPHTHFLPIPNDVPRVTTSTPNPVVPKPKPINGNKLERVPTPTGPVPAVCPVLGRESNYQLYRHPDREELEELMAFIPRFQVQKTTEKCVQAGGGRSATPAPILEDVQEEDEDEEEEEEEDVEGDEEVLLDEDVKEEMSIWPLALLEVGSESVSATSSLLPDVVPDVAVKLQNELAVEPALEPVVQVGGQQEALGMFLYDMHDVLELSVEDAKRLMSSVPDDTPPCHQPDDKDEDYSSDYESMGTEQVSMEDLGRTGIAELWDGDEVGDSHPDGADSPQEGAVVAAVAPGASGSVTVPNTGHYRSIWSWGNDLPSLPNSFSSTSHQELGEHSLLCGRRQMSWSQGDSELTLPHQDEMADKATDTPHWADDSDDVFIDDPEVQMQLCGVDPNPEPEQVIFSSDLERHWFNSRSSFTVQVPNPGQYKQSGQRKPCSFFLEGNCRRTDCKFSHDISSITCRFWEEGNCFKGVTCPFLHGYPGDSQSSGSQRSSMERDFSLEKEDFPELFASQGDDGSAKGLLHVPRRRGCSKRDDRARPTPSGEADRRRRRYRQNVSATSSQGVKHAANMPTTKDGQEKKTTPVLYTDV